MHTCVYCKAVETKCLRELFLTRGQEILIENSDRRHTSSEVKPGRAGLVLGWVTTFRHMLY